MGVLYVRVGGVWVPVAAEGPTGPPGEALPGAWLTWTPTFFQGTTISRTTAYAKYQRIGRTIHAVANLTATSAGLGGWRLTSSVPVLAAATAGISGHGYVQHAGTRYVCEIVGASTAEVFFAIDGVSADVWGISPAATIGSGSAFAFNVTYEAAS